MSSCEIVNIKENNSYDIYIGRPSIYGNPFSHLDNTIAKYRVNTVEESLLNFRNYLIENNYLIIEIENLKNKKLGCFCINSKEYKMGDKIICHGQIYQMYLSNPKYILDNDLFINLLYNKRKFNSIF